MIFGRYYKKIRLRLASPDKKPNILKNKFDIKIGEGCQIFDGVTFGSEPYLIEIGDNVRITKGVTFVTHDGGIWVLRNKGILKNSGIFGKIKIGNNVHIGINTVIMPGVTVGNNVIIGVNSVVTKDIPSNTIVAGVPARKIRTLDEYYEKNKVLADDVKVMSMKEKREYLMKKYL